MIFLTMTNELHHLIWSSASLIGFEQYLVIVKDYNTIYFIYLLFALTLIIAGVILISLKIYEIFRKKAKRELWKYFLLIFYISIPLLITLLNYFNLDPFPLLEEVPIVTAISTILLIPILNRNILRDIMPFAFDTVFNNIKDGMIVLDKNGRILKVNPIVQKMISKFNKDNNLNYSVDLLLEKIKRNGMSDKNEFVFNNNGNKQIFDLQISKITRTASRPIGEVLLLRDVTRIKDANKNIEYLSFHDCLTGLYNRAFFEEELRRLNSERLLPLSIIVGDVDGLKLINDAFGHKSGDNVLVKIAKILKKCCRKEDILARWGGDEFIMILPNTSNPEAIKISERINNRCNIESSDLAPLNISLGVYTKMFSSQDINEVIKTAEDKMYHHKLIKGQSIRSTIISSLEKALMERDYETSEHIKRIKQFSLLIGKEMDLDESMCDELELLSSLHDIGKIAISDNIIFKPGSLTDEERSIVRKHSEIGYRIAESAPELRSIAKSVSAHHEWWDGSGYPLGLKGKEIPLIARIISVVDSYDVMINDRPYKKAMSPDEAIAELMKCSGTQFDPEIVKFFINALRKSKEDLKEAVLPEGQV
jgi:diguanylate cyclase (GGDEF)-like protein